MCGDFALALGLPLPQLLTNSANFTRITKKVWTRIPLLTYCLPGHFETFIESDLSPVKSMVRPGGFEPSAS